MMDGTLKIIRKNEECCRSSGVVQGHCYVVVAVGSESRLRVMLSVRASLYMPQEVSRCLVRLHMLTSWGTKPMSFLYLLRVSFLQLII